MDEEVPVPPAAHDPTEKAKEQAIEQEELRGREEEVVSRLSSEALQHVMSCVAESLIDENTGEAIKEKVHRSGNGKDECESALLAFATPDCVFLSRRLGE